MVDFDVLIVGGGLTGMSAALAVNAIGLKVAIVAKPSFTPDGRTTALFMPSIDFLNELDIWDTIREKSSALKTMRILDGTKRLIRSRPTSFHCHEIGLDSFGYNIPNQLLLSTLHKRINKTGIKIFEDEAIDCKAQTDSAMITLGSNSANGSSGGNKISATHIIAADGRRSIIREKIGISHHKWNYRQKAIVLTFTHKYPHHNISTEFHTETGPFTQVPLPGNRSSLVWAIGEKHDKIILDKSLDELNIMVEKGLHSILGPVDIDSELQCFPISSMIASRFGTDCVMLVGEAAHAFAPIGAQGLNLGLRDVMSAIECLIKTDKMDGFKKNVGQEYDLKRRRDILTRTLSVDILNRTLLTSFLPIQFLRSGMLSLISSLPLLRKTMMREGSIPS